MRILNDILYIAFPPRCEVCGRVLAETEKIICTLCLFELPRTLFHQDPENEVSKLFWGRVNISMAASWFYFYKGSPYQSLLHKLKYKGMKEIGIRMGKIFASEIRNSRFCNADLIIPVPLHPRKKKKRGYNQSEMIARGINEIFQKELDLSSLVRTTHTDTQTRKNRFDRFLNMEGKFIVTDPDRIQARTIILVDDVVTTGSTLEACAQALLDSGCKEVMALTIAVA